MYLDYNIRSGSGWGITIAGTAENKSAEDQGYLMVCLKTDLVQALGMGLTTVPRMLMTLQKHSGSGWILSLLMK